MVDIDLDDLEEYLLNTSFEELGAKPEPDRYFAHIEESIEAAPSDCVLKIINEGRMHYIGLPASSNYVAKLIFTESSLQDIIFDWERSYQERLKASAPLARSEQISEEDLEAILAAPIQATIQTSIDSALQILKSEFEPNSHPMFSQLRQEVKKPVEEEEAFDDILVIPNLSNVAFNSYAVEDNLDVTLFSDLIPVPAIQYPFELDTFQKRAVYRLQRGQNVFVAAHTSAGKTVVAEYAIALCKHRLSRVIYTSPIKALSNQKYREFKYTFKDVGILTGDVSVDPDSFCVIMTTQILRSMLYNNSSRLRDLEWVILDEVHYINDSERGVVWEEVLIMLPPHVHIVMLSATVPNYFEFSNWVGRIRKQPVYVQVTYHRPVPLQHSVYVPDEIIPIITVEGHQNLQRYLEVKKSNRQDLPARQQGKPKGPKEKKKKPKTIEQSIKDFIIKLRDLDFLPCVMFAFSRDKVDKRGESLFQVNLLTEAEAFKVKKFSERAVKRLNPVDRQLPQILFVLRLLTHGIGVHHSGILPILKEIVEILFSKGLIKVLVATETFAMGLNMPTRTVVFEDIRKFDGEAHRYLLAGEYTQMSGRAGRRGKDDKGNVIIFFKDPMSMPGTMAIQTMTRSEPRSLESKFRIRYSQICSVMRSEDLSIEDIVKKSFLQNSSIQNNQRKIESGLLHQKRLVNLRNNLPSIPLGDLQLYFDLLRDIRQAVIHTRTFSKKPVDGSVIEVVHKDCNLPGIVTKKLSNVLECLLIDFDCVLDDFNKDHPDFYTKQSSVHPADVILVYREGLPKPKVSVVKSPQISRNQLQEVVGIVRDIRGRKDSIKSSQYINEKLNLANRDEQVVQLLSHPLFADKMRHRLASTLGEIKNLELRLSEIEQIKTSDQLSKTDEIFNRVKVLQRYDYLNANEVVQLKGMVLTANNRPNGLIVVESIFRGLWRALTPQELAGVLSVFICQDKREVENDWTQISQAMHDAIVKTHELMKEVLDFEESLHIQMEAESQLKYAMVEIAYQWACGRNFVDICQITDIKEGNIVTAINQLSDLAGCVLNSAIIIGDHDLKNKANELQQLIKRDIVFSTSLYISKQAIIKRAEE